MKYPKEQVKLVKKIAKESNTSITEAARRMCKQLGITYTETLGRAMRDRAKVKSKKVVSKKLEESDSFRVAREKKHDSTKKRFLISWCQSDTEIHEGFLKNMEVYSKEIDAEILIIAGRYKNPTSLSSSRKIESREKNKHPWSKLVMPYLDAARHKIHPHLAILSDVKIQPTSSMPLNSLNGLTGIESCIVGSPRSHLRFLPVLDGYPSKLLVTTGSVSLPNYTDTKIGKLSEFNHQIGCIIVELDGDIFHLRQIIAEQNGNFMDLCYRLQDGECLKNNELADTMVLGDIHLGQQSSKAVSTSFEMIKALGAKRVVLHDIFDGSSISHHEKKNPFILLKREKNGTSSLEKEITNMINWFKVHPNYQYIIPSANHNDFLDRWLQSADWRTEPNRELYLELASAVARGLAPKGAVAYLLEKNFSHITCLGVDESYNVNGYELSCHGDRGAGGSRGSISQFKNLNVKTVTAHTHSASKTDGHLCAGTLTNLRMGYNQGMSAWSVSNVVLYKNKKAQHIHITRGKYTTFF